MEEDSKTVTVRVRRSRWRLPDSLKQVDKSPQQLFCWLSYPDPEEAAIDKIAEFRLFSFGKFLALQSQTKILPLLLLFPPECVGVVPGPRGGHGGGTEGHHQHQRQLEVKHADGDNMKNIVDFVTQKKPLELVDIKF